MRNGEASTVTRTRVEQLQTELKAVKGKIDRLNDGFTDGSIDLTEFKELKNPLVPKKVDLEAQIAALERTQPNPVEPLKRWILEANSLGNLVSEEKTREMKSFLQKVGLNRVFHDQTLTVNFIKPWNSLAEINSATPTLSPVSGENEKWWR